MLKEKKKKIFIPVDPFNFGPLKFEIRMNQQIFKVGAKMRQHLKFGAQNKKRKKTNK